MKNRLYALIIIFSLIIGGCGEEKVEHLDTFITRIEEGKFFVNCPIDDGAGDDLGYNCTIAIDRDTLLKDGKSNELKFEDFKIGDRVKIILAQPKVISVKDLRLDASEIRLDETDE